MSAADNNGSNEWIMDPQRPFLLEPAKKNRLGPARKYSNLDVEKVLVEIAGGALSDQIACKTANVEYGIWAQWVCGAQAPVSYEALINGVARARTGACDHLANQSLMIALGRSDEVKAFGDDVKGGASATVQRERNAVDTIHKLLKVWDRKKFGDQLALTDPMTALRIKKLTQAMQSDVPEDHPDLAAEAIMKDPATPEFTRRFSAWERAVKASGKAA